MSLPAMTKPVGTTENVSPAEEVFHNVWKTLWKDPRGLWREKGKSLRDKEFMGFARLWKIIAKAVDNRHAPC